MGGQQFASGAVLLDTRPMKRILGLDTERGVVEVEAGIQWPELVDGLIAMQQGAARPWGIVQKQTGADRLTLGGALGANIHGRGLALRPIIGEVESFTLMDGDGNLRNCSRTENSELFRLAIGGYGLFGVITRVRLRLMPRTKIERVVGIIDTDDLMPAFAERIAQGFLYGDCQFSTDASSDTYLKKGVFSCYRPLPPDTPMPAGEKELGEAQWRELYYYSHADTRRAYEAYTSYYLSTTGQRYWSDTSQLSVYIDDYHADLDRRLNAQHKGTEMITELYVPRPALPAFLAAVRADFRQHGVQLIYGTIRLIERDTESFLAWAREPWVCTVMNLHVDHTERSHPQGGRRLPPPDRPRDRARRQLFPHLSPLGEPCTGRGLLPADGRVPPPQAAPRPGRGLPERLVPPLPADVLGSALRNVRVTRRTVDHCRRRQLGCADVGCEDRDSRTPYLLLMALNPKRMRRPA